MEIVACKDSVMFKTRSSRSPQFSSEGNRQVMLVVARCRCRRVCRWWVQQHPWMARAKQLDKVASFYGGTIRASATPFAAAFQKPFCLLFFVSPISSIDRSSCRHPIVTCCRATLDTRPSCTASVSGCDTHCKTRAQTLPSPSRSTPEQP